MGSNRTWIVSWAIVSIVVTLFMIALDAKHDRKVKRIETRQVIR